MSNSRNTGFLTNVIKVDATGNVSFVSGSTTLATISTSGQMSGSLPALSSSYALSASYVTNAETLDGLDSTVFTLTSSFNTTSASLYTVSSSAYATSGSLSATSGSLSAASGSFNTRVTALEVTGSALSSSILSVSASSYSTSGSLSSASGSFNTRISTVESKYATTGSNTFIGTQIISGSILQSGSFTSTGTLTAQTLVVQTITSSVVYSSGSNIFGNSLGNSQVFTGSMFITGSNITANVSNACFSGQVCSNTISTTDGSNVSTLSNNYLRYNGGDFYVDACAVGGNFRIRTSNASALDSTALFICGKNSNVGIGTTTPSYKLDVNGSFSFTTGGNYLQYNSGILYHGNYYQYPSGNDYLLFARTSGGLNFGTNDAQRLLISSTGISCFACQVCAPSAVFSKAADQVIRVETTSATDNSRIDFITPSKCYTIQNLQTGAANALIFYDLSASAERMRITNTGIACFACSVTANQMFSTTTAAGYAAILTNTNGASDSNGLLVKAGSISSEYNVRFANQTDTTTFFTVKGNGNVGIGISSPSSVLDVQSVASVLKLKSTTGTNSVYTNYENCSNFYVGTDSTSGASFGKACAAVLWQVSCNSIVFATSNTEQMRITGGGNVGIGINPTSTFFQVSGNSPDNIAWFNNTQSNGYASARFYNNCNKAAVFGVGGSAVGAPYANNGYIYTDSGVDLAFAMGGVERMRITSTGIATFTCTVCSTNFQTGANSNLSKSSIRLRSANDNKYLDLNSFNTCNVINSNYGDSDIPLILGTYFGHQVNQLFLATNCNVGIGTNTPNEKLDVNGTIQVRGSSLGYATTQCVGMLDFYTGATRLLSFGGNSTTCGGFRFYSAGQNNNGGSDVATISGGGAACFASTIQATGATIASDVVGDPVYLRVRNNNTGGYPSSLALSLYGYASPAAYFDALRIQASYPGYGSANFFVKYQSNSADVLILTLRGDGWVISPTTYNNTSGVAANLGIDSSGNIFRATSSSKYKKDIKSYDKGLDTVLLMNPIYYKSKSEFDGGKQFAGFIAEEIDTLGLNEFVQYNDETNEPEGLNYGNITAILTKAIQELKAQNDTLKEILQRNNIQ